MVAGNGESNDAIRSIVAMKFEGAEDTPEGQFHKFVNWRIGTELQI